MIIDIVAGIVLILSALWYSWKGLATSIIHMLQWFLCVVVGLLFCDNLTRLLMDRSPIGNQLNNFFDGKLNGGDSAQTQVQTVYDIFQGYNNANVQVVSNPTGSDLSQIFLAIISFVFLLVVVKVLLLLFCKVFPQESYTGMAQFLSRLSGVVCGTAMGFLYILLLLTLLLGILAVIPSGAAASISDILDNSFVTGSMFNSNPLLVLIRNLFT